MISTHLLEHYLSKWPKQDVITTVLRNRRCTAELVIGNMPDELASAINRAERSNDIVLKTDLIRMLDTSIDTGVWVSDL